MSKTDTDKSENPERIAYRVRELAEMTGVPCSTIRKRIRTGDIRAVTSLGVWLVPKDEVDRLMGITLHEN